MQHVTRPSCQPTKTSIAAPAPPLSGGCRTHAKLQAPCCKCKSLHASQVLLLRRVPTAAKEGRGSTCIYRATWIQVPDVNIHTHPNTPDLHYQYPWPPHPYQRVEAIPSSLPGTHTRQWSQSSTLPHPLPWHCSLASHQSPVLCFTQRPHIRLHMLPAVTDALCTAAAVRQQACATNERDRHTTHQQSGA